MQIVRCGEPLGEEFEIEVLGVGGACGDGGGLDWGERPVQSCSEQGDAHSAPVAAREPVERVDDHSAGPYRVDSKV